MSQRLTVTFAVMLVSTSTWLLFGCDETDGTEEDQGDRGGCCTEGTDSDSEETVLCDEEPLACDDIGATEQEQAFGCCHEETVYWCDESQLDSLGCEDDGLACGYDPDIDALGCV